MAIDLALLEHAVTRNEVLLRLYHWSPFCLSFGRHEPALRRYGRDRVAALDVDLVRRPTGGRAVWHARELTYAVGAPESFGSLPEAYRTVHLMLLGAVHGLGVAATLAAAPGRTPGPGAGACFALPVGGEVVVGGRKVLGSAQLRGEGGLLQHGSLLLADDQRLVHQLAGVDPDPAPEVALREVLGHPVSFDDAARAVIHSAEATWGAARQVDPEPVLRLAEAHTARFRSDAWTWSR